MPYQLKHVFLISMLFVLPGFVSAQSNNPDECYKNKDPACLESIYRDIFDKQTPDKVDAIYLHAMLSLEDKRYEDAKDQLTMAIMFGDTPRSEEKYKELITSGNVEIEAFDCLAINSEECLFKLIESKPEKADVAYYHLAGMLSKTDPKRAAEYTLKAAKLGHGTSECLLAFGYAHEKGSGPSAMAGFIPELPKDYAKARLWGEKCGHGAFPGFNEKHFEKYKGAKKHSAYAKFGRKHLTYTQGAATPEIAASVASALCERGVEIKLKENKIKQKDFENNKCLIVSVDGEWVDYFEAEPLPARVTGVDGLLHQWSREHYPKYESAPQPKVFVQGPLGNSYYLAGRGHGTLEELTKAAIATCHESWRYTKYGSECRVINANGEWVDK